MANCFGEIVDNCKLDRIPRYVNNPKTQEDRAREAMLLKNEDNKNDKASTYVDSIGAWYGDAASTLCLIYNATGETLHYVAAHDWLGYIGRTPYPHEIGNGQWAAFHHVGKSAVSGSEAAVVYRGKNKDGHNKDFLVGWSSPRTNLYRNKAYCAINEVDYFQTRWDTMYDNINNADYFWAANYDDGSCNIEANTATGFSPKFIAIITTPYGP